MARYYANKDAQSGSGDHEVHKHDCTQGADQKNREDLGEHSTCHSAIGAAKQRGYRTADGCYYCSPACHKS